MEQTEKKIPVPMILLLLPVNSSLQKHLQSPCFAADISPGATILLCPEFNLEKILTSFSKQGL
jgi:hypothetical protein